MKTSASTAPTSRRQFVKTSAAGAVSAVSAAAVASAAVSPAALFVNGDDAIRVGLIGCGGRGSGAAAQALNADPYTKLVALADVFEDQLDRCEQKLSRQVDKDGKGIGTRVEVDDDHKFVGFDAYKGVIENSDVVLLASTPHFRPRHLRAAIEAGKHVFCEKPVAVDGPGVRSVVESVEMARQKNLSLVSGLCWRYHHGKRAVFDQIENGTIGDIVSMQCSYMTGGVWDPRRTREECDSEMEYQLRNWYYYTWLSGDFNVEQHIHSLDKMQWAMKDVAPATISASGGRQQRTDPKYGNIYDHFNVVYTYPNGVKAFARCRHWQGCENDVNDYIYGTKAYADVMAHKIYDLKGKEIWSFEGEGGDMYQIEHNELFASIRGGNYINNGDYMVKSTMMAISGRMAAYTGKLLTWDDVMNSKEDLTPVAYEWGDVPVPDVAIPGKTKFV